MLTVTLRLLCLVALGVAQKQTVSVWMPPDDPQLFLPANVKDVAASIIGLAASSTTYVLDCTSPVQKAQSFIDKTTKLSDFDANSTQPDVACGGFPAPYTIVQGPSTVTWSYNVTGTNFLQETAPVTSHAGDCSLSGTTEAVCTTTEGTRSPFVTTYRQMTYTPFDVAAGAVAATSTPISASITEHTKKKGNSTVSHTGKDTGADSTTRDPSGGTQAMSGSSGLSVFQTGAIAGISSVKASAPTNAPPKSTNIGVQGSSSHRDGVFGALVIALAGAIL